jgi:hypothetical protein
MFDVGGRIFLSHERITAVIELLFMAASEQLRMNRGYYYAFLCIAINVDAAAHNKLNRSAQ